MPSKVATKKSRKKPFEKSDINLKLSKEDKIGLFRTIVGIRRFEERSLQAYNQGKIGGFLHLYIGQEAVAAGIVSLMEENDHIITAYRDHGHALPKKVRALGLKSAMSSKASEGKLIIIDKLSTAGKGAAKTAALKLKLAKLGAENALFIGGTELDDNFVKAASNLPFVDVLPQQGINVYDILRRDVLVLSKDAATHLEERLK